MQSYDTIVLVEMIEFIEHNTLYNFNVNNGVVTWNVYIKNVLCIQDYGVNSVFMYVRIRPHTIDYLFRVPFLPQLNMTFLQTFVSNIVKQNNL